MTSNHHCHELTIRALLMQQHRQMTAHQQTANSAAAARTTTPGKQQQGWSLDATLHQLLDNRRFIMDLPPINDTPSTQGISRYFCSPMTGTTTTTTTPALDGLAAIAAAIAPVVVEADNSLSSEFFSLPLPTSQMMMTSQCSPSLCLPANASPAAYPMPMTHGARLRVSSIEAGDVNLLYLLLARQQQQKQQQQQQQQQQQKQQQEQRDFFAERLAAAAVAVLARCPTAARPPLEVSLMQQMLLYQQQTIEGLTREVATLAKGTGATARRERDDNDGDGDATSTQKHGDHRRPNEMMVCFPHHMGTRPTPQSIHAATNGAAAKRQIDATAAIVAAGLVGFQRTAAGPRQSSQTTSMNGSFSHSAPDSAGLNRHGLVSDASLLATRGHETFEADEKQQASSSSSSSSSSLSAETTLSTAPPCHKPITKSMSSTIKPPKRSLSAYNIFFQHERARLIGQEDVDDSIEEKGSSNHSTEKEEHPLEESNNSSAAFSATDIEEGSGQRKRKKTASSRASAVESSDNGKQKKRKKIGFALLAQTIATTWKSMDATSRSKYDALSVVDRRRYQTELLAYKAQQEVEWLRNHQEKSDVIEE